MQRRKFFSSLFFVPAAIANMKEQKEPDLNSIGLDSFFQVQTEVNNMTASKLNEMLTEFRALKSQVKNKWHQNNR